MANRTAHRWVILATVGYASVLGQGGGIAHAGKNSQKKKSRQAVDARQYPYLMVLRTGNRLSAARKDEYDRRMKLSEVRDMRGKEDDGGLAPLMWWVTQGNLQSRARDIAARALVHQDGYVWVSEPTTHKRLMIGVVKTPVLEFGGVREAEVGRYRCAPTTYKHFFEQHQAGSKTLLPEVSMINPLVRAKDLNKDPRFKEKELSGLLTLKDQKGSQATRITASYAENVEEDDGRIVDSLHLQLPSGREICFTVDRPIFVTRTTYEPRIMRHARSNALITGLSQRIGKLPPPETIARMLDAVQMVEQGSLHEDALVELFK